MTGSKPPFPPSGSYLSSIRETSRELRLAAKISITDESIERLLASPAFKDSFERVSQAHGLAFPLKFASNLDELNVLCILSLLNFGSGYRAQLHAATGRGAWDTMRAFVLSLYIGSSTGEGDMLSASGMQNIQLGKVAELLGVNVYVERPHEKLVGVTVGELGGALYDLVKMITDILNETGRLLVEYGYPNLGSFVLRALEEGQKAQSKHEPNADIEVILERIVGAFPGFQDMATVNGKAIYCFKKALFLIHAVTILFGSKSQSTIPIPDTRNSPVFADNVLPSMLVHFGVIDLKMSPTLSRLFPDAGESVGELLEGRKRAVGKEMKDGPVVTEEEGYILRGAAIEACERIGRIGRYVETAVDMWVWAVAKDSRAYRELPRLAERDTVYF
ncbi:hypothetical protein AMATHDRAFT_141128 [Amanita thiersii Skay4041]|uniref:Queuosine 5'-phosphate N-glycosylase/hydrolase n=1 Tax=Amanita thiersii Skay4041 TaxID=703135 RepID=A0A2A9NWB6_9AGAR|nr:hypothetical protein AMATHDRAFT_141128 [Amanita thiersii Skay4041]